MGPMRKVSL